MATFAKRAFQGELFNEKAQALCVEIHAVNTENIMRWCEGDLRTQCQRCTETWTGKRDTDRGGEREIETKRSKVKDGENE